MHIFTIYYYLTDVIFFIPHFIIIIIIVYVYVYIYINWNELKAKKLIKEKYYLYFSKSIILR